MLEQHGVEHARRAPVGTKRSVPATRVYRVGVRTRRARVWRVRYNLNLYYVYTEHSPTAARTKTAA